MRVDAHHHVWDLAVRSQPWTADLPVLQRSFGIDELRPELASHRIDATVVVQTVLDPDETPELLALAATDPVVAGVVGWVELTGPDVAERITRLRALPGGASLAGIRHQVQAEPDPRWLCRTDVRRSLAAVADAGLAYDLVVLPHQLPAVIDTAAELPQLRFILDHAGKPPIAARVIEPWRDDIHKLAALPNVAAKLSGLVTEADHQSWTVEDLSPYAEALITAFGARRILFGSDWPVCLLAASYSEVVTAAERLTSGLSSSERSGIFGGNAEHWYRLGASRTAGGEVTEIRR